MLMWTIRLVGHSAPLTSSITISIQSKRWDSHFKSNMSDNLNHVCEKGCKLRQGLCQHVLIPEDYDGTKRCELAQKRMRKLKQSFMFYVLNNAAHFDYS